MNSFYFALKYKILMRILLYRSGKEATVVSEEGNIFYFSI